MHLDQSSELEIWKPQGCREAAGHVKENPCVMSQAQERFLNLWETNPQTHSSKVGRFTEPGEGKPVTVLSLLSLQLLGGSQGTGDGRRLPDWLHPESHPGR